MHDYPLTFNETVVSILDMRTTWSAWLENGRNSSVSTGIEEWVNDSSNPINKEK